MLCSHSFGEKIAGPVATSRPRVSAGRVLSTTDANHVTTEYHYDGLGRVTGTVADMDGLNVTTSTEYDVLGRRVAQTDAAGQRTSYVYDDAGRLTEVHLPGIVDGTTGSTTGFAVYRYGYDAYGNQTSVTDPNGHTTTFTYDAYGRQKSRMLPDGLTETFDYDQYGRELLHTDFEGHVTWMQYTDPLGWLSTILYFDDYSGYVNDPGDWDDSVSYSYDAQGRVITVADSDTSGVATKYYDADGRLIQLNSQQGYLNYAYDRLGRLTRTWSSVAGGGADAITDTDYGYDALGRLISVTVKERNNSGPDSLNEATEYFYDANGNLDLEIRPGNVVTDYQYDALNRLTTLLTFQDDGDRIYDDQNPNDTLLGQYVYTLDDAGQRTHAVETDNLGNTTTIDWVYDELGRLTEEHYDFDDVADLHDDDYDYVTTYGFDLASNRKQTVHTKGGSTDKTTYDYDQNDRLLSESLDQGNDGSVDQFTEYGYQGTQQTSKTQYQGPDDTGPLLNATTYEYDLRGRMTEVAIDDGSTLTVTTYKYNSDGVRVEQSVSVNGGPATVTTYHIDPQNHTGYAKPIEELVDGALERSYVVGLAIISQASASGDVVYLLHDGHGSTRALWDAGSGQVVERYAYNAYGETLAGVGLTLAGAAQTTWLFGGDGQYDPASGLTNHIRRWRDGARFLTLDPFAGNTQDPLSLHKYLYTHGNPIMGADPTGMFESLVGIAVGNSIGAILSEMNVSVGESVLSSLGFDENLDGITRAISAAGSWVWDQLPQSLQDALSSAFDSAYEFVADHIDEFSQIAVGASFTAVAFAGNYRQLKLFDKFSLYNGRIAHAIADFTDELGVAYSTAKRHLNSALGDGAGDAHHIIPWDLRSHELVERAARGGFNINGVRNGIRLGRDQHYGPHPKYNTKVQKTLTRILNANPSISDLDAAAAVQQCADQLRAALELSNTRLT